MIEFNDYARKGLVAMNKEFDNANDGILSEFVMSEEANGTVYPTITPAEIICENFEDKKDMLIAKLGSTVENAATVIDNVMNAIIGKDIYTDKEELLDDKLDMVDELEPIME